MRVIAFANHKGGVAKTTSVVNIGAYLATRGYRTLLIDMDAQANLTASLMGYTYEPSRTMYHALKDRKGLPVENVAENLFLAPSSLELAGIDMELSGAMSRESILKRLLHAEAGDYDYILLDCPPSLGLLAVSSFVASDRIVVPLTAEALPIKGLSTLEEVLRMVQEDLNQEAAISGIFLTKWKGTKLNQMAEQTLKEKYGDRLLSTKIRVCVALAEAPLSQKPIYNYAPKSNGASDYASLSSEIERHIL